jgi:hypothetical protein
MTAQQLREVVQASPFVPFTLHMANGRSFHVPHPDFISQHPEGGRIAFVYLPNGASSIVDIYLVTELELHHNGKVQGKKGKHKG